MILDRLLKAFVATDMTIPVELSIHSCSDCVLLSPVHCCVQVPFDCAASLRSLPAVATPQRTLALLFPHPLHVLTSVRWTCFCMRGTLRAHVHLAHTPSCVEGISQIERYPSCSAQLSLAFNLKSPPPSSPSPARRQTSHCLR